MKLFLGQRSHSLRKSSIFALVASALTFVLLAATPAYAVTPSGQVNYFNVSGGVCTSTAWTGATAVDGNVPGEFSNNVGGPPNTAVVGTGSICIQVVLTGATPNTTYTVTGTQLSCTITINTNGGGNGSGQAVCTSTFSGACVTNPLKMSPETPFVLSAGQIAHVWVGTGAPCTPITTTTTITSSTSTTTITSSTSTTTVSHGVPEFPGLGLAAVLAIAIPALFLVSRFRKPI